MNGPYYLILIVFTAIVVVAIVIWITLYFDRFYNEMRYLKVEIRRTSGAEREYWLHKKKNLIRSLIPFYLYFHAKKKHKKKKKEKAK